MQWFDRKFDVANRNLDCPGIMERLKGTSYRIRGMLSAIPFEILGNRINNSWSIKENIGHLSDIEPLWQQRIRDFQDGAAKLTDADLSNRRTWEADHNSQSVHKLMETFTAQRLLTVTAFETLQDSAHNISALHPRLLQPMRPVDLAYFVAEHDDHHLARITAICRHSGVW